MEHHLKVSVRSIIIYVNSNVQLLPWLRIAEVMIVSGCIVGVRGRKGVAKKKMTTV
jgi:hypothetical protein